MPPNAAARRHRATSGTSVKTKSANPAKPTSLAVVPTTKCPTAAETAFVRKPLRQACVPRGNTSKTPFANAPTAATAIPPAADAIRTEPPTVRADADAKQRKHAAPPRFSIKQHARVNNAGKAATQTKRAGVRPVPQTANTAFRRETTLWNARFASRATF